MVDLTQLNTLRVPAKANALISLASPDQIKNLISQGIFQKPFLFLGQGANILFTKDFPGTIIKIKLAGIKVIKETDTEILLEAAAGELWHTLVEFAVDHNWSGIENMALIPGSVGAAAYGNIAAYGQNLVDVFDHLKAINLSTGKFEQFNLSDCKFGYRESIFKHELNNKYLITSVTLRLSKVAHLETSYHATRHASLLPKILELKRLKLGQNPHAANQRGIDASTDFRPNEAISIHDVFDAVVAIRTEKLPDWRVTPNAGSFFKNPLVTHDVANKIKSSIPDLQLYPPEKLMYQDPYEAEKYVKLPAGMLLDHSGWRGKRIGNVGTSPSHALVIINYGATGFEIYEFSEMMRADIKKNFNIDLEYEVVII